MKGLKLIMVIYIVISVLFFIQMNNLYTDQTIIKIKNLKKPLLLKDKTKMTFRYSIIVMDGDNNIHKFGNSSDLANKIGEKYEINDTIEINKLNIWD
jgi:hypothetical protein